MKNSKKYFRVVVYKHHGKEMSKKITTDELHKLITEWNKSAWNIREIRLYPFAKQTQ